MEGRVLDTGGWPPTATGHGHLWKTECFSATSL